MLNVMLVEDELLIRSGMRALINWEDNGFKLEAEASNGEEALELLKVKKIDIVITDIRMPVMDGLKLIENLRLQNIPCEIIVLSSYDDFQYVKSAMKQGVKDYIHKPTMSPQELMDTLLKVKAELGKAHSVELYKKILNDADKETQKNVIERTVKTVLKEGVLSEKISEILEQVNIIHKDLFLMVFKFAPKLEMVEEGYLKYTEEEIVDFFLKDMEQENHIIYIIRYNESWVALSETEFSINNLETANQAAIEKYNRNFIFKLSRKSFIIQQLLEVYTNVQRELEESFCEIIKANKLHPSIKEAVEYIKGNYTENITLDEVAMHIHVSSAYLSRLFFKETGRTFIDYLTKLRIDKSKRLLVETKLTVYDISEKVGYQNSRYFMKLFKKLTGITPSEYREKTK